MSTSDNLRTRSHFLTLQEANIGKSFKTAKEQMKILKSRGLIIENDESSKEILSDNNYYYLINGYKDIFIDKSSKEEKYIE